MRKKVTKKKLRQPSVEEGGPEVQIDPAEEVDLVDKPDEEMTVQERLERFRRQREARMQRQA